MGTEEGQSEGARGFAFIRESDWNTAGECQYFPFFATR